MICPKCGRHPPMICPRCAQPYTVLSEPRLPGPAETGVYAGDVRRYLAERARGHCPSCALETINHATVGTIVVILRKPC